MKVLAAIHGYPGPAPIGHNAGAEKTVQAILEWLVARGHECAVAARDRAVEGNHNGVEVKLFQYPSNAIDLYRWADVVITHLDLTKNVCKISKFVGKPLIHLIHNHRQLRFHRVKPDECALAVFNSQWVAQSARWEGPSMVLYPPINFDQVRTPPGNKVTLINLLPGKGGNELYEIAQMCPERQFLGVLGSYGAQVVKPNMPKNLQIVPTVQDIRKVYAQTGILLMPSEYESFGRTAIEAMSCGIPVIAAPTSGLLESAGDAAIFINRHDIGAWVHQIRTLKGDEYQRWSMKALKRAEMFRNTEQLELLERKMSALCNMAVSKN